MSALRTFPKNKVSSYTAKQPDVQGIIHYSDEDHAVWQRLYERQIKLLPHHACQEFIRGLDILDLTTDRIPQCADISSKLQAATGFSVVPVPALIPDETFFSLLSQRQFPAATFIRSAAEFDYLQEPDLFHEFFGHCPMLTDTAYADFSQRYGQVALASTPSERMLLARLYWFTVEFGLIQTAEGIRAYGGGILSSPGELPYAVNAPEPLHQALTVLDTFRTPYRIDMFQPLYYVIDDYATLHNLLDEDLPYLFAEAARLGDYAPLFPTDDLH